VLSAPNDKDERATTEEQRVDGRFGHSRGLACDGPCADDLVAKTDVSRCSQCWQVVCDRAAREGSAGEVPDRCAGEGGGRRAEIQCKKIVAASHIHVDVRLTGDVGPRLQEVECSLLVAVTERGWVGEIAKAEVPVCIVREKSDQDDWVEAGAGLVYQGVLPVPENVTADRLDQSILIWAWAFALANPRRASVNPKTVRSDVEVMRRVRGMRTGRETSGGNCRMARLLQAL